MSMNKKYLTDGTNGSLNQAAQLMGRKGGPAAAKVRFSKMTMDQRSEHGRKLASARWNRSGDKVMAWGKDLEKENAE